QKHPTMSAPSGDCLRCAAMNGLLDLTPAGVTTNAECEDLSGTSLCLTTLACNLGLHAESTDGCAAELYSNGPTAMGNPPRNAFRGAVVTTADCARGLAGGACRQEWRDGCPGQDDPFIQANSQSSAFPSGMANLLASGLLTPACAGVCFP